MIAFIINVEEIVNSQAIIKIPSFEWKVVPIEKRIDVLLAYFAQWGVSLIHSKHSNWNFPLIATFRYLLRDIDDLNSIKIMLKQKWDQSHNEYLSSEILKQYFYKENRDPIHDLDSIIDLIQSFRT
jgi:hypothetical protein